MPVRLPLTEREEDPETELLRVRRGDAEPDTETVPLRVPPSLRVPVGLPVPLREGVVEEV